MPDESNLPHFLPVWRTLLTNTGSKPRPADDYQPRVQISRLFKAGTLNLDNNQAIVQFSKEYAVEVDLVKKAVEHLVDLKHRANIRANQRNINKQE